jgi:hypothetical protein
MSTTNNCPLTSSYYSAIIIAPGDDMSIDHFLLGLLFFAGGWIGHWAASIAAEGHKK